MKNIYETPELKIAILGVMDVLNVSNQNDNNDGFGLANDNGWEGI